MKHEKISMKWKVFFYMLGFTIVLLVILWLFQISYLDVFYKAIKTGEAEKAIENTLKLLEEQPDTIKEDIDTLAAECNLSILVTNIEGTTIYNAEYIPTSKMHNISPLEFSRYYQEALDNGGSAKIEFQGSENMTLPENGEMPEGMDNNAFRQDNEVPNKEGFIQNPGAKMMESVVYVNLITVQEKNLVLLVHSELTPVDATVTTLQIQLVWISIIMLVLSLLIALLLSRNISKSIVKINETAKELAKGDYTVEFSGKDYREAAELSDTLNFTAKELEKTENLRRELIANVSHDLRTPLTMIIAYSEVMRDLPGENSPENIQVVIDESMRLTNLVNDMLDISKLQAGVVAKELSVYNLTESIQVVFQRYNKLKEQEGYTINFEYEQEVFVEADEFKIFQVIYNLINNAINYAGEDKSVWVRQSAKGTNVRIEVTDTGMGIHEEDLSYVWDRYYKVDKSHKRAVTGTGLGLSIAKNILLLHKAQFGVDSILGKGSTFWFELEVAPE